MHGLKLSLRNPICNHDVNDDTIDSNYFERGKYSYGFHNKFSDPLYVP